MRSELESSKSNKNESVKRQSEPVESRKPTMLLYQNRVRPWHNRRSEVMEVALIARIPDTTLQEPLQPLHTSQAHSDNNLRHREPLHPHRAARRKSPFLNQPQPGRTRYVRQKAEIVIVSLHRMPGIRLTTHHGRTLVPSPRQMESMDNPQSDHKDLFSNLSH